MNSRDQQLISKFVLGGGALGGGSAALVSLLNHLKMLKQQADSQNDTSADDDTLYVNVPQQVPKAASAIPGVTGGLAITGGILSLLGSYAAVRSIYQKMKKKDLQSQLDESQVAYLDDMVTAKSNGQKVAGFFSNDRKPMSTAETLPALPIATLLAIALGSGAMTYQALGKAFPNVSPDDNPKPKRIVLRKTPVGASAGGSDSEDTLEDEAVAKAAAADWDQASEFLVRLVGSFQEENGLDTRDLIKAAAVGRFPEIEHNTNLLGFASACELVKGASCENPISNFLAPSMLLRSPVLRDSVLLTAASEFAEAAPAFLKLGSALPEQSQQELIGLLADLNRMLMAKEAARLTGVPVEQMEMGGNSQSPNELQDVQALISRLMKAQPNEGIGVQNATANSLQRDSSNVSLVQGNESSDETPEKDLIDSMLGG